MQARPDPCHLSGKHGSRKERSNRIEKQQVPYQASVEDGPTMAYAGKTGEGRFQGPNSRNHNDYRPGAVAVGLTLGLLLGAGVALFFAPMEGRALRYSAGRGLRRIGRRGRDTWADMRYELRRAARRARQARRVEVVIDPGLDA
jgi:hypothetical protein